MSILEDRNPGEQHYDFLKHYQPLHDRRPLDLCGFDPRLLTRVINSDTYPKGGTPYGLAALDSECRNVALTPPGNRNNQLLMSSSSIGQLIAGGVLQASHAGRMLARAAEYAGLGGDEISRTIFREDAGLSFGAKLPRNEYGWLIPQYLAASFQEGLFTGKLYTGSLDLWNKRLDYGELGISGITIVSQFEQLGVLYLSNYLYFLAEILRAVLRNVPGTGAVLARLNGQYLAQADLREAELLEIGVLLRLVLGNLPASSIVESGEIIDLDFQVEAGVTVPDEWLPVDSNFVDPGNRSRGVENE